MAIEINKSLINIGIYRIVNTINGKEYIGSSKNLYKREKKHMHYLAKNKHDNKYLQNAYNLHGHEAFLFEIIEECSEDELILKEQAQINTRDFEQLYNLRKVAHSNLGLKLSPETLQKMSDVKKGKVFSEEHKANISKGKKGKAPRPKGFKHKEGQTQKIKEGCYKKIYCKELDRTFESCTEAAKEFSVSNCAISQALKKGFKIQGKYSLLYEATNGN